MGLYFSKLRNYHYIHWMKGLLSAFICHTFYTVFLFLLLSVYSISEYMQLQPYHLIQPQDRVSLKGRRLSFKSISKKVVYLKASEFKFCFCPTWGKKDCCICMMKTLMMCETGGSGDNFHTAWNLEICTTTMIIN